MNFQRDLSTMPPLFYEQILLISPFPPSLHLSTRCVHNESAQFGLCEIISITYSLFSTSTVIKLSPIRFSSRTSSPLLIITSPLSPLFQSQVNIVESPPSYSFSYLPNLYSNYMFLQNKFYLLH